MIPIDKHSTKPLNDFIGHLVLPDVGLGHPIISSFYHNQLTQKINCRKARQDGPKVFLSREKISFWKSKLEYDILAIGTKYQKKSRGTIDLQEHNISHVLLNLKSLDEGRESSYL